MAYFNYHMPGLSSDQPPRMELVAEDDESLENVLAAVVLGHMAFCGNTRGFCEEDVAELADQSLNELARLAFSSAEDMPIDLVVQLEDVPHSIPVKDAQTGELLDQVFTKDGHIVRVGEETDGAEPDLGLLSD